MLRTMFRPMTRYVGLWMACTEESWGAITEESWGAIYVWALRLRVLNGNQISQGNVNAGAGGRVRSAADRLRGGPLRRPPGRGAHRRRARGRRHLVTGGPALGGRGVPSQLLRRLLAAGAAAAGRLRRRQPARPGADHERRLPGHDPLPAAAAPAAAGLHPPLGHRAGTLGAGHPRLQPGP